MYKVVLIDDEPLVIEGLLEMVHWNEFGYKVSGVAYDGEEGYRLIESINPDLVITDIRMPGMDGLQLMEKCKKDLSDSIQFAILSGYSDFKYIQKALSFKSLSYLLKPLDKDEIHQLLNILKDKIEERKLEISQTNQKIEFVLRSLVRRLIEGEVKETLLNRIQFILNAGEGVSFQYILIEVDHSIKENRVGDKTILQEVDLYRQTLFEDGREHQIHWHMISGNQEMIEFLLIGHGMTSESSKDRIHEMIDYLKEKSIFVRAYGSSLNQNVERIKDLYQEAKFCSKVGFYDETDYIAYELNQNIKFSGDLTILDISTLALKIKKGTASEFEYFTHKLFAEIQERMIVPCLLKDCIRNTIKELSEDDVNQLQTQTYSKLKKSLLSIGLALQKKSRNACVDVVEQIKEFVEKNYSKEIKLKDVANYLNFNAVYIGQLFQKQVGCKYNDYVLQVRMSKAKEFLLYTDMRIKEVSDRVGFYNPDYFVLKFKEIEGISPSMYRHKT